MIKIIVGSKNPVKIKCIGNVFSKYFQNIKVIGKDVDSLVSDQPRSEKETILGAKNRAKQIFKRYNTNFGIGIEGGLEYIEDNLYTFAWICIKSKNGKVGMGRTMSFLLPPKIEKLIKEGKELGEADDIVFGVKSSKHKMGSIGLLSKGKLDRVELYEQGVISALLPFLNGRLYSKRSNKEKEMEIYFAGSILGGKNNVGLYSKIINHLKKHGQVLTEHVGNPFLTEKGEDELNEKIYSRDIDWLKSCDVVIAEVSIPSLGVGYEIAKAEELRKKILCLYQPNQTKRVSAMVSGSENLVLKEYRNFKEAILQIDNFLKYKK